MHQIPSLNWKHFLIYFMALVTDMNLLWRQTYTKAQSTKNQHWENVKDVDVRG